MLMEGQLDQQTGEYVVTWEREVEDNQGESEHEQESAMDGDNADMQVKKAAPKK